MNTARVLEYPSDTARAERELRALAAKREGWDDRKAGRHLADNPFDHEAQAWLWLRWRDGWQRAGRGEGRS
jgi:hypothetical protein